MFRCSTIKYKNQLEDILQYAEQVNPHNQKKERISAISTKLSVDDMEDLFEVVENIYTNNQVKIKESNPNLVKTISTYTYMNQSKSNPSKIENTYLNYQNLLIKLSKMLVDNPYTTELSSKFISSDRDQYDSNKSNKLYLESYISKWRNSTQELKQQLENVINAAEINNSQHFNYLNSKKSPNKSPMKSKGFKKDQSKLTIKNLNEYPPYSNSISDDEFKLLFDAIDNL